MERVQEKWPRWRTILLCTAAGFWALVPSLAQSGWDTPASAGKLDGLVILHAFYEGNSKDSYGAIIKTAIATFGYPGVFAAAPFDDGTQTTFALRDGSSVLMTNAELAKAKTEAKFLTDYPSADKRIADQAETLYAVMVARAVDLSPSNSSFKGISTWTQAELLLSGAMGSKKNKRTVAASDLAVLLGLKSVPLESREPAAYVHVSGAHAAFATGDVFDRQGVGVPVWKSNLMHGSVLRPTTTWSKSDFALSQ
jgi:hypothetical protein